MTNTLGHLLLSIMTLQVSCFTLGPASTNCYLVADAATHEAVVIDPSWDAPLLIKQAQKLQANLKAIWLTHAHFDHIGAVAGLVRELKLPIALHSLELPLYKQKGGALLFGINIEELPTPTMMLDDYVVAAQSTVPLHIGAHAFEVRFVPGHTLGHVAFYQKEEGVVFSGDVLFEGSIGRTDLPGGNYERLIESIQTQLLTLPDVTRVYSGHGGVTTIGVERETNPFLS